jgi:hypothetical protein
MMNPHPIDNNEIHIPLSDKYDLKLSTLYMRGGAVPFPYIRYWNRYRKLYQVFNIHGYVDIYNWLIEKELLTPSLTNELVKYKLERL